MKKNTIFILSAVLCSASLLHNKVGNIERFTTFEQQNIEALSAGERPGEAGKSYICYKDLEYDEKDSRIAVTVYCGDCTEMPYTTRANQLMCKVKKWKWICQR